MNRLQSFQLRRDSWPMPALKKVIVVGMKDDKDNSSSSSISSSGGGDTNDKKDHSRENDCYAVGVAFRPNRRRRSRTTTISNLKKRNTFLIRKSIITTTTQSTTEQQQQGRQGLSFKETLLRRRSSSNSSSSNTSQLMNKSQTVYLEMVRNLQPLDDDDEQSISNQFSAVHSTPIRINTKVGGVPMKNNGDCIPTRCCIISPNNIYNNNHQPLSDVEPLDHVCHEEDFSLFDDIAEALATL